NQISGEGTRIFSTEGMIRHTQQSPAREFVVATEVGVLHRMRQGSPDKLFIPANENAVCDYMKMITLEKVHRSLRDMVYEIRVDETIASRARLAIDRMLQLA